jgi:CYTH domain-containing protein
VEVQVEWLESWADGSPSVEPYLSALVHRRDDAKRGVRRDVVKRFDALFPRLWNELSEVRVRLDEASEVEPSFGPVVGGRLRLHHAEAVALLEDVRREDHETVHVARIAIKRLRYLVEPLCSAHPEARRVVTVCKALQDVLGELNDAHVLEASLPGDEAASRKVRTTVGKRSDRRKQRLFQALDLGIGEWVGELALAADALAEQLEAVGSVETERKFLLSGLPPGATEGDEALIEQGWLPGVKLHERLRRITRDHGVSYRRTVKLGAGLSRIEVEEIPTAELFDSLWPLTEGCRVRKRRYTLHHQGLEWVVDEFLDQPLYLAEVEMPSPRIRPATPPWLAPYVEREVTGDGRYVNLNLAK